MAKTTSSRSKKSRGARQRPNLLRDVLLTATILYLLFALPLLFHRSVFLLDWVMPTRQPLLDPSFSGINISGISAGDIFGVILKLVNSLTFGYTTQFVLLAIFVLGSLGIYLLLEEKSTTAQSLSSLLFLYNPFIFDRIYAGQLSFVVGYSLLPLIAYYLRKINEGQMWLRFGLLWVIAILASPHFFWIVGALFFVNLLTLLKAPRNISSIIRSVKASVFVVGALVYQFVTTVVGGANGVVTSADLNAYRTAGSTWYGAFGNVLGLYGFWRRGPRLARDVVTGWPVLLAAILGVAALGIYVSLIVRSDQHQHQNAYSKDSAIRRFDAVLLSASVIGLFLALGSQGPSKPIYDFLFYHVPTFAAMREAQKFDSLWALSMAYYFGRGIDEILIRYIERPTGRITVTLIAVCLIFAYEPLEAFALNGQISASNYPSDWPSAYQVVAESQGRLLCLPWHLYEEFNFSSGRVIANPCANYFGPKAIQSQNAELPGLLTSNTTEYYAFLNYIISKSNFQGSFGQVLNVLGIQDIVLFKTADYKSYSFLNRQSDLKVAFDGKTIEVLRNLDFQTTRPIVNAPISLQSWGGIISLEQNQRLLNTVTVTDHQSAGAIIPPEVLSNPAVAGRAKVLIDPYGRITVSASSSGYVEIPYPWIKGWTINDHQVQETATGQILLKVNKGSSTITFEPRSIAILTDIFSLAIISSGVLYLLGASISPLRAGNPESGEEHND